MQLKPRKKRTDKMQELLDRVQSLNKAVQEFPESFHSDLRKQIDLTAEEYMRVVAMTE